MKKGRIQLTNAYENIISVENVLEAWREFVRGKRKRKDVQEFSRDLMRNVLSLQQELAVGNYSHSPYEHFKITDPKPRDIHKACVRDRLLHRALYRVLYPFFDRTFIADSYSCRNRKGTHKALNTFRKFYNVASRKHTRTVWVLKCDVRKFFASIDHTVLKDILASYISDTDIRALLAHIIDSFHTPSTAIYSSAPRGLPLGNLTSQLLVNIYLNEFDQYMKHTLKATYYIRYADDFVILSPNREELDEIYRCIGIFLNKRLKLTLHPDKCSIKTYASGVDFLGWVHFPTHRVLRTVAKRRMLKVIMESPSKETCTSYQGMLSHGNTRRLQDVVSEYTPADMR